MRTTGSAVTDGPGHEPAASCTDLTLFLRVPEGETVKNWKNWLHLAVSPIDAGAEDKEFCVLRSLALRH
ncbi:hypothetical protein [Streptomyces spinosirectus]